MNDSSKRQPLLSIIPIKENNEKYLRNWYMEVADFFINTHVELQYPNVLGDYLWNLVINVIYQIPFATPSDNIFNKYPEYITLEDVFDVMIKTINEPLYKKLLNISNNKYIYKPKLRQAFLKITNSNIENIKNICKNNDMEFYRIYLWIEYGTRLPYNYTRKINFLIGDTKDDNNIQKSNT